MRPHLKESIKSLLKEPAYNYMIEKFVRMAVYTSILLSYTYFSIKNMKLNKLLQHQQSNNLEEEIREKEAKSGWNYRYSFRPSVRISLINSLSTSSNRLPSNQSMTEDKLRISTYKVNIDNYANDSDNFDSDGNKNHFNNTNTLVVKSRIPKINRILKTYLIVSTTLHFISFCKYAIICLLDLDIFKSYRYIDCFLVGRFGLTGRTADSSKYVALFFNFFHLLWRFVMFFKHPKLRLDYIEFLFCNYDEIVLQETESIRRSINRRNSDSYEQNRNYNRYKRHHNSFPSELNDDISGVGCNQRQQYAESTSRCDNDKFRVIKDTNTMPTNHYLEDNKKEEEEESCARINQTYESIFYIGNKNWTNEGVQDHIYRPNRTAMAWSILAWLTVYIFANFIIIFLPLLSGVIYSVAPLVLTQKGFELSYFNCVDWLQNQSNEIKEKYENIYNCSINGLDSFGKVDEYDMIMATESRKFTQPVDRNLKRRSEIAILPLIQLRPANLYNILKISADILDNSLIWWDTAASFVFHFHVALLGIADLLIYSTTIKSKLKECIDYMRKTFPDMNSEWRSTRKLSSSVFNHDHYKHHQQISYSYLPMKSYALIDKTTEQSTKQSFKFDRYILDEHEQNSRILVIQRMMIDCFGLISRYAPFPAIFVLFSLAIWILYSAVVCGYTFSADNPEDVIEYYYIQVFATSSTGSIILIISLIRSFSHRMYPLIASAMALDSQWYSSKLRWSVIIQHYFPRKLHCFTLFDFSEISLLFGLQLLAWMLSASLVISSFYEFYRLQDRLSNKTS